MKKKGGYFIFLFLILNISILLLMEAIKYIWGIDNNEITLKNEKEISENIFFYSILVVLIAPTMEEILFRLPLKKTSAIYMTFIIGGLYLFIYKESLINILLVAYLIGVAYYTYVKKESVSVKRFIIGVSILTFVCSHISNYEVSTLISSKAINLIFLFMPQFIVALITTHLRLKFSFIHSLVYHSLYNMSNIFLALLFGEI